MRVSVTTTTTQQPHQQPQRQQQQTPLAGTQESQSCLAMTLKMNGTYNLLGTKCSTFG